jgi:NADH-quinone oxidoreductase subunit G
VAELNALDRALIVGSFLRKDHPLVAQRLRQAAKKSLQVSMLHSVDDDWLLRIEHKSIVAPSQLPATLAGIIVAAAQAAGKTVPAALQDIEAGDSAKAIAASLLSGKKAAIVLSNYAATCRGLAIACARANAGGLTGATLGFLTEAANTVGAILRRRGRVRRHERARDAGRPAPATSFSMPSRSSISRMPSLRDRLSKKLNSSS